MVAQTIKSIWRCLAKCLCHFPHLHHVANQNQNCTFHWTLLVIISHWNFICWQSPFHNTIIILATGKMIIIFYFIFYLIFEVIIIIITLKLLLLVRTSNRTALMLLSCAELNVIRVNHNMTIYSIANSSIFRMNLLFYQWIFLSFHMNIWLFFKVQMNYQFIQRFYYFSQ